MHGNNPIRKPLSHDGSVLEIKSIFATLQGEGPYAGWPSVFIRLGGCNLACIFCDTDFEDFAARTVEDIASEASAKAADAEGKRVRHLIVITGGEPFRQNIAPLCERLIADGFKIQVETNGTLYRQIPAAVDIVCSPKNTGAGYHAVREDLLSRAQALKFIISAHDEKYRDVAEVGQSRYSTPVYVQPMDEYDETRNRDNLERTIAIATRMGYRVSLQTHKILGID